MSAGIIFLGLVIFGFIFFATQWGSSRGPGARQKDFIYLFLFLIVGVVLMFVWGGHIAFLK